MRLFSAIGLWALVSKVLCDPGKPHEGGRHGKRCIDDAGASQLVGTYVSLFEQWNEAKARTILDASFTEYSDSLNFLVPNNTKLTGDAVVSGLEAFVQYRAIVYANYGPTKFDVVKIWHGCNDVTFLWRQQTTPIPTQGVDVLELDPYTHLIKAEYAEINTLAYLVNAGCQLNCPTA